MVGALFEVVSGQSRVWNMFSEASVRGEFANRLLKAAKGGLQPVDEIKSLRGGRDHLFEIRWPYLNVTEHVGGEVRHVITGARLIHAEPESLSVAMVGLHAHEKSKSERGPDQDHEIDHAERIYYGGVGDLWGLKLRT